MDQQRMDEQRNPEEVQQQFDETWAVPPNDLDATWPMYRGDAAETPLSTEAE